MDLTLETERLILGLPEASLAASALDFHLRNSEHLAPWSPPKPEGFETPAFWNDYVEKSHIAFLQGASSDSGCVKKRSRTESSAVWGFSQIFRGPFCNCVLGYQIDKTHEGKGLMREALQSAITYMFEEQKLHRINANYRPENVRSGRLLSKLGFHTDGFAPRYLFIDGEWRDHIQTSLINDAFRRDWLVAR